MTRFATAVLLVFLAFALVGAQDDPKKVMEALQGEWKLVSFVKSGQEDKETDSKVTITGNKMNITYRKKDSPATFTIDPKANPPAIDMKITEAKKDLVAQGIYKLDKDTLTICFTLDQGTRPKDFKPAKDNGVMVMERMKK